MKWRDGLGKALQDERPDQSTSNGPISDFVVSFMTDAAFRDTESGTLRQKGQSVLVCSVQLTETSRPTRHSHTKSVLLFCFLPLNRTQETFGLK